MTYNLFLDDEHHPSQVSWVDMGFHPFQCVIVKNFEQFKFIIEDNGLPDKEYTKVIRRALAAGTLFVSALRAEVKRFRG